MARSRELKVIIAGDADKLNRELRRSNSGLDKLGKQTRVTSSITSKGFSGMRVAAVGAAGAIGGVVVAGRSFINAALEAEKSQARMTAQLKASGISYRTHADEIDRVIQRHSRLAGLDDEDLQDAFTNIVRTTGNVTKAMRLTGLAADFARGRQIDVAKAGDIVAKVAAGNVGVLGRYGVKLREGATASEALAALQQKFAGQAEAYGRTNAGAADRAAVAYENLKETLGGALAPVVGRLSNRFARFVTQMQTGTGQGGRFADKLREIWAEARPVVEWIGRATVNVGKFVGKHPQVGKLAAAVLGVGVAVKTLRFVSAATGFTTLLKAGSTVMGKLVKMFVRQGAAAGAAAGRAAAGSQGMTSAAVFNRNREAGRRVGRVMGRGMVLGIIAGFAYALPDFVRWVEKTPLFAPFRLGKKIGEKIGDAAGEGIGKMPAIAPGKGSSALQGANSALAPIAGIGRRFGLAVSSGKFGREKKLTSTGNVSYHSTGEAIDLSGPPRGMMRTFRWLKSTMGARLAELIYTPGGVGIKNGRPHTYTGKVAADHYDHVHAALDLGRPGPGIGDGTGRRKPGTGDGKGVVSAFHRAIRKTKAGPKAALALFEAGIVESGLRNLPYGDRDSVGALQQRPSQGWTGLMNPYRAALEFLRKAIPIADRYPTAGRLAQAVQRSAYPDRYDAVRDRALRYVRGTAGGGGSARTSSMSRGGGERVNPFEMATAAADLAIAEAEGARTITLSGRRVGPALQQLQAVQGKRAVVAARIRKIRAALRKKQSPANRLRLTNELTQLLGEHRELGARIGELRALPEREETADVGGDLGGDVGGDVEDPNRALVDAIEAQTELLREKVEQDRQIAEEHARLLAENTAETARLAAIGETEVAIGLRESKRAIADLLSGHIGHLTNSRLALAGSGALARY